jgi:four helix bundle protein
MEYEKVKINSFTDLNAWKEGHNLVLMVYRVINSFPSDEKFALTSQIKRSAVSVTSNIAEGFSRKTKEDKNRFYFIAMGSLTELENQLIVAKDIKYLTEEKFYTIFEKIVVVRKLIKGLLKSSSTFK